MILFPTKKGHTKVGDSPAEDVAKAAQQKHAQKLHGKQFNAPKAKKVEQQKTPSFVLLRRARADARLVGRRKVRAEKAAEAAKTKKQKGGE